MIMERLKKIREDLHFKQSEFSKELGITQNALSQYENGRRKVSSDIMSALADKFSVNITWLVSGKGNMYLEEPENNDMDLVYIDIINVRASAGFGIENYEEEVVKKIPIASSLIYFNDPKKVKMIEVSGQSMEPTLYDGDFAMVSEGQISGNGIYLINRDGELLIKRLKFKLDSLSIISDNPNYKEEIMVKTPDNFKIIGRVIAQIHHL